MNNFTDEQKKLSLLLTVMFLFPQVLVAVRHVYW